MANTQAKAAAEIKRAIRSHFAGTGEAVVFEGMASRPWASVTFSGERHRLALRLSGPGAEAAADSFLDGLADRDFPLRGHVLADIEATGIERGAVIRLTLDALTVAEG